MAVFGAASETFTQKNVNCSIDESIRRFSVILEAANKVGVKTRGYISTVVGCPYEGKVKAAVVARMAEKLLEMGCYEISLGDTIGVGTPGSMNEMLKEVMAVTTVDKLAVHCHDTYGQALVNILTSLDKGTTVIEAEAT